MHRPERMLKTTVLGGGENPSCALKLVNVAQPLHPRGINQRFFRHLPLSFGNSELYIAVYGICDQSRSFILATKIVGHRLPLDLEDKLRCPLVTGFFHAALVISDRRDFRFHIMAVGINFFPADISLDERIFDLTDLKVF